LGSGPSFERIPIDTAVAPDRAAVSWINPRLTPGETRRVLTGIPGKTGVVYTIDRATGEFLWARPTVTQNVISAIDGATGDVTENAEVVFGAEGQDVLALPHLDRRQGLGVRLRIRGNPNRARIHWVIRWTEHVRNRQKSTLSVTNGWQSGWQPRPKSAASRPTRS